MRTAAFARELKLAWWAIFIYNPLPGSELFRESVERGYITEESFFETGNQYFSSIIDSEEWTAEELEALIRWESFRSYFTSFFWNPYLISRRWYGFFRYRPSFLKYLAIRTARTFKLRFGNQTRS